MWKPCDAVAEGRLPNALSRFSFYTALALSCALALVLLSAATNFGLGQVTARGPAVFIVAVLLLNPVVFGVLGYVKRSAKWQFVAAGAMLMVLLLYLLLVLEIIGPIPN